MSEGVVTLGESMGLLRAATHGSLEHVGQFALGVGGAESNVAIGVARLGASSSWIGRVGDDGVGRRVLRELRAEGVGVRTVVDERARTGLMLKESPLPGTTRVLYYRTGSAGSLLEPGDLDHDLIASAGVLHVTGITLALSESASATVHAAVDIAVDAGVPVSFDVNHRASLWDGRDAAVGYRAIAARADIVFAGADEAMLVTGSDAPGSLGARQNIVKLGADGCAALIDGVAFRVPALAITPVDTVGAGDAFVAGYLTGLLDGLEPLNRLELATRCGAYACLGEGDWESLPRRSDLAALDTTGDPVVR